MDMTKPRKLGDNVAACELRPRDVDLSAEELKHYLGDHLKPYGIPAHFVAVDKLPPIPSHKSSQLGVQELFANR